MLLLPDEDAVRAGCAGLRAGPAPPWRPASPVLLSGVRVPCAFGCSCVSSQPVLPKRLPQIREVLLTQVTRVI